MQNKIILKPKVNNLGVLTLKIVCDIICLCKQTSKKEGEK